jgi:hypothetical protein
LEPAGAGHDDGLAQVRNPVHPFAKSAFFFGGNIETPRLETLNPAGNKAVNRLLAGNRLIAEIPLTKVSLECFIGYFLPENDVRLQELHIGRQQGSGTPMKAGWRLSGTIPRISFADDFLEHSAWTWRPLSREYHSWLEVLIVHGTNTRAA